MSASDGIDATPIAVTVAVTAAPVPPVVAPVLDSVLKLADDLQLRRELGRRGRAFVEEHYAKSRILGAFKACLDDVAAGR